MTDIDVRHFDCECHLPAIGHCFDHEDLQCECGKTFFEQQEDPSGCDKRALRAYELAEIARLGGYEVSGTLVNGLCRDFLRKRMGRVETMKLDELRAMYVVLAQKVREIDAAKRALNARLEARTGRVRQLETQLAGARRRYEDLKRDYEELKSA